MRQRRAIPTMTDRDLSRFWSKVLPENECGCRLWSASCFKTGYGAFQLQGQVHYAHRVSLTLTTGPRPEWADETAHSCRNRSCVAPSHLRWATYSQNNKDKVADGTDNRGGKHPLSKLDEAKVLRIRDLAGSVSRSDLAAQFDIRPSQLSAIINRKAWTHI